MDVVSGLALGWGVMGACLTALGLSKATFHRRQAKALQPLVEKVPRPRPPRALSDLERDGILALLHEPQFVDLAPAEIYV